ncbi:MAG: hypothetical protein IPL67_17645 [Ignavibacteria bacterium]|nr:hypothetical protein [Ignavibacteria bacterium]
MEESQNLESNKSAWDPEDPRSNTTGALFGTELGLFDSFLITEGFIEKFESFMKEQGILDKDDPSISRDKVRIRENEDDDPLPSRPYNYEPYRGEPVQ